MLLEISFNFSTDGAFLLFMLAAEVISFALIYLSKTPWKIWLINSGLIAFELGLYFTGKIVGSPAATNIGLSLCLLQGVVLLFISWLRFRKSRKNR